MKELKKLSDNIYLVNLKAQQAPENYLNKSKGIISWGKKNDYPSYLLYLYENHAEHGGIINGKTRYVVGTEIVPSVDTNEVKAFLSKANPYESWFELSKKLKKDQTIYNGYAVKVTTNMLGVPLYFEHIDMGRLRVCDDLCSVKYSEDWSKYHTDSIEYQLFDFAKIGTKQVGEFIYIYRSYSPKVDSIQSAYPNPEYLSCILDIDTDIEISQFGNSLIKNGFSAGHIITIFSGEPTEQEKESINDRLLEASTGSNQAGKVLVSFAPKDGKGAEITSVNVSDLDKQYQEISKRNLQKILTGHNVPGVLFKIQTEGKLGQRNELIEAHELFINEYAKPEQMPFNELLKKSYKARSGQDVDFEIKQFEPIGLELPLDNQNIINLLPKEVIVDYIVKKYGLDLNTSVTQPTNVQPVTQVNEALKGLTGRQMQNLMRIVRKHERGELSKDQALVLIKGGFGVTDSEAMTLLNAAEDVKFALQTKEQKFFELINKYGVEFSDDQVLEIEDNRVQLASGFNLNSLRNSILNIFKGNPDTESSFLKRLFGIGSNDVNKQIDWLEKKGLVEKKDGSYYPTEKALNKETNEIDSEVVTLYTYEKREDVDGPTIKDTTRQFCRDMYNNTHRGGKKVGLSYEMIDNISNEFGENAWDYRGGWYNDGTDTTPWCRHVWQGQTILRKK